ncbi:50S ribosomal protein L23 [Holospora obtusa F1]|uniref:Large ribosomal subunit protein uL23 n=1 Tax=Holospora obtusa F1 TaxID=1399147 RepID=W6TE58_HOLOB|nr:50S ribosomal protein L23 [Holospora obtusa]ETZ07206.1 50S ribosomal protein L23 [Holospora obtusa F1]
MIYRFWNRDRKKKMSEAQSLGVIICEIITEKSFLLNQKKNQRVFKVAVWANKIQIKEVLKRVLGVNVVSVNTLLVKGKSKRFKGRQGETAMYKKAVVRFPDGYALDQNFNFGE